MTPNQVMDILETIEETYSNKFRITEKSAEIWLKQLSPMCYERTVQRLQQYIVEKPFPPSISEIAARPKPKNNALDDIKQWEKESLYARDKKPRS